MKKILLPTDFSENAQKAIDYAVFLFKNKECTFYILNAFVILPSAENGKSQSEEKLSQTVQKLNAEKTNPKHYFEQILIANSPLNAINVTVIDKGIELVFMGTKGATGLSGIFMGSTTSSVIKHIEFCPIMAVPALYNYGVPEEIIFANDYKKEVRPQEIEPLITIAKLWQSKLGIVHITAEEELTDTQKVNKELLRNSLKGVAHLFVKVTMDDSLSSTIQRLEKEDKNIGMVAMLKNKHGFIERLVREPVIRNVTFTTEVPFLVLPTIE